MDDPDVHFLVGELLEGGFHRLHAALDVGLDDEGQLLPLAGLDLVEQILQADLLHRGGGLGPFLGLALLHQLPGHTLVADCEEGGPGGGSLAEARDLHGDRGTRLRKAAAPVVQHGPHPAHGGAGNDNITLLQGAVLDQQGRHRAPALVQTGFDDGALARPVGIGLQLRHFGGEGHHLQKVVNADVLFGGNFAADGFAAPVLGDQAMLGELLHYFVGVGVFLVDFVHRHHNGDVGCFCVADGFNGLGHDAVVCRHHQNGDIRHHGAPGAHGGERLVTRRVQEGDGLAVQLDLIGADVLGDAAGLAGGHGRIPNGVQKGGFAVIHVAHDHHYRGTGDQVLRLVLGHVDELFLNGDHDFLFHLAAHFLGDEGGGVVVDHLGQGGHDAVFHQGLDHLRAGFLHPAGQLAHGNLVGNLDGQGRFLGDLQLEAAHLLGLLLPALAGEGNLAPLFAAGVAELLLVLLPVPASAGSAAALGHVLKLLVVFVQVDVGGLPGVHHLGLGHPGRGLLGLGGRLRRLLRLPLLLGTLGLDGLLRLLGTGRALAGGLGLLGLRRVLNGGGVLLPGSRSRLLRRGRVRVDGLDVAHLMILGEVLKDKIQLLFVQVLAGLLLGGEALPKDLNDLLGLHSKVPSQFVYFILIHNTQSGHLQCVIPVCTP